MTTKNGLGYQVVYRGETVDYIRPGSWVFFQRPIHCGGGYWCGEKVAVGNFCKGDSCAEDYDRRMKANKQRGAA
ncbi:TPA: hypothetical protein ACG0BA_004445 [Serratia odorifera]